jgi:hypothetical protein
VLRLEHEIHGLELNAAICIRTVIAHGERDAHPRMTWRSCECIDARLNQLWLGSQERSNTGQIADYFGLGIKGIVSTHWVRHWRTFEPKPRQHVLKT